MPRVFALYTRDLIITRARCGSGEMLVPKSVWVCPHLADESSAAYSRTLTLCTTVRLDYRAGTLACPLCSCSRELSRLIARRERPLALAYGYRDWIRRHVQDDAQRIEHQALDR